MVKPTCPNNYKQEFLAIKYDYDTKCSMTDEVLASTITRLDDRLQAYEASTPDTRPKFCFAKNGDIIGSAEEEDGLQLYTKEQCESMRNGKYNSNGECTKSTGGSYSWDCRPAAGSGGSNTEQLARDLSGVFQPISQYYADLASIKVRLQKFLECSSSQVTSSHDGLINEQRFDERAAPQETVSPRELVFGLFSEFRPSSVPIILAAGVFMACLTILMTFQMLGFTGEIHPPPALMAMTKVAESGPPLYQNPMVLSGLSIVLGALVIVFGVLYYRSKK